MTGTSYPTWNSFLIPSDSFIAFTSIQIQAYSRNKSWDALHGQVRNTYKHLDHLIDVNMTVVSVEEDYLICTGLTMTK